MWRPNGSFVFEMTRSKERLILKRGGSLEYAILAFRPVSPHDDQSPSYFHFQLRKQTTFKDNRKIPFMRVIKEISIWVRYYTV